MLLAYKSINNKQYTTIETIFSSYLLVFIAILGVDLINQAVLITNLKSYNPNNKKQGTNEEIGLALN